VFSIGGETRSSYPGAGPKVSKAEAEDPGGNRWKPQKKTISKARKGMTRFGSYKEKIPENALLLVSRGYGGKNQSEEKKESEEVSVFERRGVTAGPRFLIEKCSN